MRFEVAAYLLFELIHHAGLDVELPLEVRAHLPLHRADFPESGHALADDGRGLAGVGVVADDKLEATMKGQGAHAAGIRWRRWRAAKVTEEWRRWAAGKGGTRDSRGTEMVEGPETVESGRMDGRTSP